MTDSIQIGKFIYARLNADAELKSKLTDTIEGNSKFKVYPLIANSKTTYPFVTYKKDNITNVNCKDGWYEDLVQFSVSITDINYDSCSDIANRIRRDFEVMKVKYGTMEINGCHITGADEIWNDEAFIQVLTFQCKVNEK